MVDHWRNCWRLLEAQEHHFSGLLLGERVMEGHDAYMAGGGAGAGQYMAMSQFNQPTNGV